MRNYITNQAKFIFGLLPVALISLVAAATLVLTDTPQQSSALSGSDFQAGRIIDDEVFYNDNSMTVSQIQQFLNARVPNCDTDGEKWHWSGQTRAEWAAESSSRDNPPYTCLKEYIEDIPSVSNSGSDLCTGSISGGNRTSARIIHDVAKACGINPQTLIVMLQKEQSLITDDWPWEIQYNRAMGYACPDSGENFSANCNSDYYGFFNQVYNAAKAFKRYEANPTWYNYRSGRNNTILYNPDPACGSSTVFIENQATANLYIYTPYQPNQAALDNLYGTGNNCSAYGNRNFWRMFHDWFGPTVLPQNIVLVQCDGENYMIERNRRAKRLLTDEAMSAWNLTDGHFIKGSSQRCGYSTYTLPLERLIGSRSTGRVYLVDNGNAWQIRNSAAANAWGLGDVFNETYPQFDGDSIHFLNVEYDIPRVATSTNPDRSDAYIINNGKRHRISGTRQGDTSSLQLVRGYNEVPMGIFSVDILQLPSGKEIDYSFQVGADWYLLNHNETRRISSNSVNRWETYLDGPKLNASFLDIFDSNRNVSHSFFRSGYAYHLNSTNLRRSTSGNLSNKWTNSSTPTITRLLTSKLVDKARSDGNLQTLYGLNPTDNIRLIRCDGNDYLVERNIRRKRLLTDDSQEAWGIDHMYYKRGDRGCSYSSYTLELNNLIRSRNTGYVYYVEDGDAWRINSQSRANKFNLGDLQDVLDATHPQFDPPSIHFLDIVR